VSGLVAAATTLLHLAGRFALAVLLIVFLAAYAALGFLLAIPVGGALAAIALAERLRARAGPAGRWWRSALPRRLTGTPRPWTMPPT
jgi:hypothetical protein